LERNLVLPYLLERDPVKEREREREREAVITLECFGFHAGYAPVVVPRNHQSNSSKRPDNTD